MFLVVSFQKGFLGDRDIGVESDTLPIRLKPETSPMYDMYGPVRPGQPTTSLPQDKSTINLCFESEPQAQDKLFSFLEARPHLPSLS